MRTSEQADQIFAAIAAAQGVMGPVLKESDNPFFKSKYADLAAHLDQIRGALSDARCCILQDLVAVEAGVEVTTRIAHASGQWVEFGPLFMPVAKADPQAYGSACTYGRRYALSAAAGTAQEDDDANAAVKAPVPAVLPKRPKPEGFDLWVDLLWERAAGGRDPLSGAWKAATETHRDYMLTAMSDVWESVKAKAKASTPKAEK